MKNIELLAPAGSYDAALAAIANGANAIYIGGSLFSARASATNFTNEEIIEITNYAHLRNIRVFVAINTLYNDEQFNALYDYIAFLYQNQVDAIIIQDLGLLKMVKIHFPDFEVHISTQASIYNPETVSYYQSLGVDRVVLARENSIDEIKTICMSTSLDVEVFVHGAICMGYSGQCLFSSFMNQRSGNRGSCSQPCRLKYKLVQDQNVLGDTNYLLSPKDLCTIENVPQLIEAGITSFKIEGRMKRPEYVATVVKAYRQAIDQHLNKTHDVKEDIKAMKQMFNRGFTTGHLFKDGQFLSQDFPGHRGLEVGKVIKYNHAKKMVYIQLSNKLRQNDRIIFKDVDLVRTITKLYQGKNLVNHGKAGEVVAIQLNQAVQINQIVSKVYDYDLIKVAQQSITNQKVRIPIIVNFYIENQKPVLELIEDDNYIKVVSDTEIEVAIKASLDHQRIEQQLSKLGQTTYYAQEVYIDFPENYTFSIKLLNEMRRLAIEKLNLEKINKYKRDQIQSYQPITKNHQDKQIKYTVKIKTIEQFNQVIKYPIEKIYVPYDIDLDLILKQRGFKGEILLYVPYIYNREKLKMVCENYHHRINSILVNDFGAYELCHGDFNIEFDYSMNLINNYALEAYQNHTVFLSREMTLKQIEALNPKQKIGAYIYGYVTAMVMKHCVVSQHYFGKKVINCQKCKQGQYIISDEYNNQYPLLHDEQCHTTMYQNRPVFFEQINQLNIDFGMIEFTVENPKTVCMILDDYCYNISVNQKTIYPQHNLIMKGYFE